MKRDSRSTRFEVTSDTLMKFFDDKVALTHMQTKRLHVLNPTAALIWKSICDGKTRGQIEELLSAEYTINSEELSQELDRILTVLKKENFISHRL